LLKENIEVLEEELQTQWVVRVTLKIR
jgi:hypothetical protein